MHQTAASLRVVLVFTNFMVLRVAQISAGATCAKSNSACWSWRKIFLYINRDKFAEWIYHSSGIITFHSHVASPIQGTLPKFSQEKMKNVQNISWPKKNGTFEKWFCLRGNFSQARNNERLWKFHKTRKNCLSEIFPFLSCMKSLPSRNLAFGVSSKRLERSRRPRSSRIYREKKKQRIRNKKRESSNLVNIVGLGCARFLFLVHIRNPHGYMCTRFLKSLSEWLNPILSIGIAHKLEYLSGSAGDLESATENDITRATLLQNDTTFLFNILIC